MFYHNIFFVYVRSGQSNSQFICLTSTANKKNGLGREREEREEKMRKGKEKEKEGKEDKMNLKRRGEGTGERFR